MNTQHTTDGAPPRAAILASGTFHPRGSPHRRRRVGYPGPKRTRVLRRRVCESVLFAGAVFPGTRVRLALANLILELGSFVALAPSEAAMNQGVDFLRGLATGGSGLSTLLRDVRASKGYVRSVGWDKAFPAQRRQPPEA